MRRASLGLLLLCGCVHQPYTSGSLESETAAWILPNNQIPPELPEPPTLAERKIEAFLKRYPGTATGECNDRIGTLFYAPPKPDEIWLCVVNDTVVFEPLYKPGWPHVQEASGTLRELREQRTYRQTD